MEILIRKRNGNYEPLMVEKTKRMIAFACRDLADCDPLELELDAKIQFKDKMSTKEIQQTLIRTAIEKIIDRSSQRKEAGDLKSNWQYVAARLFLFDMYKEAAIYRHYTNFGYGDFISLIKLLVEKKGYGEYILEHYTDRDLKELGEYIKPDRDYLFNYEGVKLLSDRYLVRGFHREVYELPQERFMVIAMHLAIPEGDKKVYYAKQFYDILSELKMTVATPTLANAGTPFFQLSSCFISSVGDNLWSIYDVNTKFAQVSKHGGALGIYMGKIRALNSDIRGHKNASGGVIPWARLYNDTAVAVDQLGKRKGGATVTLDIWHRDVFEFIDLRTNNGDDRRKAHDIFPSISIPNLFMKRLLERKTWALFDPHEIKQKKGYALEDFYDAIEEGEFTKHYLECEADPNIQKEMVSTLDIMKKIMKSAVETGTPFLFFRDTVNRANPNSHMGMIYASNLCHEIAQNMSESALLYEDIEYNVDGDPEVIAKIKPGDMVTCNLNSINLGKVDREELSRVIPLQVRMLDNVITLNRYPVTEARLTANRYRAIGLGTSGYHHYLAKRQITWESEEHLKEADALYEDIAYETIRASMELAKEKGAYPVFEGSDWQTGVYFEKRKYSSSRFQALKKDVEKFGIRNGYLMAIAPTGSTSNIANTTAGIDPIFKRFFIEEKKGNFTPKTAPDLDNETFWYYKEAHTIEQEWSIQACGIRQRHIDQSQSFNMYITPEMSAKDILGLYISAWKNGLKTIYYVRNKSLEMDECTSCSS